VTQIYWFIAIFVLQAVIAAVAKKAKDKADAAVAATAAGNPPTTAPTTAPRTAPAATASRAANTKSTARAAPAVARGGTTPKAPPKRTVATATRGAVSGKTHTAAARPHQSRIDAENIDAMHSRERLAQSVAKVRAAEAKVVGLAGVEYVATKIIASEHDYRVSPASIRSALRNPARVREAFVLAEILGKPKSMV
jgi:chorismate mutase